MRRDEGSTLLVVVMLLVLLGLLGFAALDTVTRDQQVAGYLGRSRVAFYAAEAGLANAREVVRTTDPEVDTPPLAGGPVGTAALYPYGQPAFTGDPDFADPIRAVGTMLYTQGSNLRVGRPILTMKFYQVNVVGQTNDGTRARLESVVTTLGGAVGYGG